MSRSEERDSKRSAATPHEEVEPEAPRGRRLAVLGLTALGIVYGDIGTSPLYAIRECFYGEYGIDPSRANVLGVLSLVLWSLLIVVSVKYLTFILRADNRGEGGIIALMAWSSPRSARGTAVGWPSWPWGFSGRRSSTATA